MASAVPCLDVREMLTESAQALAHLEADRLEEMARRCETLLFEGVNQPQVHGAGIRRELSIFRKVLQITSANHALLKPRQSGEEMPLEYGPSQSRAESAREDDGGDD